MLVKAIVSFAGKVSMCAGEIREVEDKEIAYDLLNAGYVEEVKEAEEVKVAPKQAAKAKKKK